MAKRRVEIPDAQVAAFLRHYVWLLKGKPRERLAYRIIERQREEIARLRMELDVLKGSGEEKRSWSDRVSGR
jgi:hypothetical protein